MTLIGSALLLLGFLGFPFYWGTLGHPGYIMPIAWAAMIALIVSARRWRHIDWTAAYSFGLTLVVSMVACTSVFMLGRFLGR